MNDAIALLHESIAAQQRGMSFLAASKARRAARLLEHEANRRKADAGGEPDPEPLGEVVEVPLFLRPQAE